MAIYANITIDQGSDFNSIVEVTADDGSTVDLTGHIIRGQARRTYTSVTSYDFIASVQDALRGTISLGMPATSSASMKSGRYVYDVEVVTPSGEIYRVVEGQVEITPNVTR